MAKKNSKIFKLTLRNYFNLIKLVFRNPNKYADSIPLPTSYKSSVIFFIINFGVASLGEIILITVLNQKISFFFSGINTALLSFPLVLLGMFIEAGVIFVLARILGGKGSFRDAFGVNIYAGLPLIFSFIPYVALLAFILEIYILVRVFARSQQITKIRSAIAIISPIVVVLTILLVLGIIGPSVLNFS